MLLHPSPTSIGRPGLASALAAALCLSSCSGGSRAVLTRDSASLIQPIGASPNYTGTLLARVNGIPRDIEYYVNGVRIDTGDQAREWKDASLELKLRPGRYKVEARYKARLFAGQGVERRIVTYRPVEVFPGRVTRLLADGEKDWRGLPDYSLGYFRIVEPEPAAPLGTPRQASAADEAQAARPPRAARYSSARVPVELAPPPPEASETGGTTPVPDRLLAPGGEPAPRLPEPSDAPRAEASIIIRGNEVLQQGWSLDRARSAPGSTPQAAAPPTAAESAGERAAATEGGRVVVEDAGSQPP